jgi:CBS domain-containing membrane protein
MNIAHYIALLHRSEAELARAYREVGERHQDEPDVLVICQKFAKQSQAHSEALKPFRDRYGEDASEDEPERLHSDLFNGSRGGSLGLLRDLHDLFLMATEADMSWTVIAQAAQALRDRELLDMVHRCEEETAIQLRWLKTRIKQAAPQTLVAARPAPQQKARPPAPQGASVRDRLIARFGPRGEAAYAGLAALVAIAVSGLAAHFFKQPLLFPSLGPSVFLFFETPLAANASPRNTIAGHLVGLVAGLAALAMFGLWSAPSILVSGVTLSRVGAAAVAVALTSAILVAVRLPHPPAGATTLIVALGLLTGGRAALFITAGVVLMTVVSWLINRAMGVPAPVWAPKGEPVQKALRPRAEPARRPAVE